MELKEILKRIFPGENATFSSRGGREVNGLAKNTVPQNCEILVCGLARTYTLGRQEHFLVRVDGVLLYLRVCTAMEGSGYDEFAVIYSVATLDEEKTELEDYARSSITCLCAPR